MAPFRQEYRDRTTTRSPFMTTRFALSTAFSAVLLLTVPACQEKSGSVPDVPAEELTSDVPELDAVHEIMAPMWHDAFPARDVDAIRAAVAEFKPLVAALDTAQLPGILQDKAPRWNEQKGLLMESFHGLEQAAEEGNDEGVMAFAEAFHMNYEGLVRIIRPVIPELDVFHQKLYALYHYYGPGYDLAKITRSAEEMAQALPPLEAATLPERLSDRQEDFDAAVAELGARVAALQASLEDPARPDVEAAIEEVHTAYEAVEDIFN